MNELVTRHCVPCEKGTPPLSEAEARRYLWHLPDWEMREGKSIRRRFRFGSFPETIAFVNRIAEIAEAEGHHPDLRISYDRLTVELTTHAIKGLSENDFILAAKINRAFSERETAASSM